jgi:hypothetical protein
VNPGDEDFIWHSKRSNCDEKRGAVKMGVRTSLMTCPTGWITHELRKSLVSNIQEKGKPFIEIREIYFCPFLLKL